MISQDIKNLLEEKCQSTHYSCPNSLCGTRTREGCPGGAYIDCLSNKNGQPAGPRI